MVVMLYLAMQVRRVGQNVIVILLSGDCEVEQKGEGKMWGWGGKRRDGVGGRRRDGVVMERRGGWGGESGAWG